MNQSSSERIKKLTKLLDQAGKADRREEAEDQAGNERLLHSAIFLSDSSDWQTTIWREWHNCEDQEYAHHLFELVANTLISQSSVALMALFSALYGVLTGYLLGLIAVNLNVQSEAWTLTGMFPLVLAWLGGVIGGLAGVWIGQQSSWRLWLGLLTPNVFANKIGGLGQSNLGLMLGFIGGSLFSSSTSFDLFWTGVIFGIGPGLLSGDRGKIFASALAGGLGAVLGGAIIQGNWLGVGLGITLGVWLGITQGSAPLGLMISGLGGLLGIAIFGLGEWLAGWLGLGVGFGLGLLPNLLGRGIDLESAYNYRSWYFWWRGRSSVTKVEHALQLAQMSQSARVQDIWREPLHHLQQQKAESSDLDRLIAALQSDRWVDRLLARHALISMGGEATEALRTFVLDQPIAWQQTVIWMLTHIEQETTNRLAWRLDQILCPRCLTRFDSHAVTLSWGIVFTYYGCRACGQSREFLEGVKDVVAILYSDWPEAQQQRDHWLRVNWLAHRTMFDFDRVEIIQATDEDVERFAVQAGNDTDPFRQKRYQQMQCTIAPACNLSKNTLRILQRMFGQVAQLPR